MEKLMFITLASILTAKEAENGGFPLTGPEGWQYLMVMIAAVFGSLATESSKRRRDEPFYAPTFWGNVGIGIMAGFALPLLLTATFEYFSKSTVDWKTSVGLGILGAYVGRDALVALFTALKSIGTLFAKLKGLNVSFTPPAPPTAPKEGKEGENDT